MDQPKPFVKWVGGKTQLLSQFKKLYPKSYNNYFEPFLGGGAVFFHLKPQKAYLNDINKALVWTYRNIKRNPQKIISLLENLRQEYYVKNKMERENLYYSIREDYNDDALSNRVIEKSAFLIFLNKTCYNGLYRENSKGKFNVPFGRYKKPRIIDKENLFTVHRVLKNAKLTDKDFEEAIKNARRGDFVYFDPPYYPLNLTSNFTNYSAINFLEKEQKKLKRIFKRLDKRGCFVMLSNSYTDFIRNLYKEYKQITMMASRQVSCKGKGRGKIKELVILNYKP